MKDLTVKFDITIREAMKALDKTGEKCLLVVDNEKKLLGTLSDGDLRRSILGGVDFNDSIEGSYNPEPILLVEGTFTEEEAGEIMTAHEIELLPILDEQKRVIDYVTAGKIFGEGKEKANKQLHVPVVIMAGGKGTRLEPFTKVLPKPLVPIHEKPIIEHIIERFSNLGCNDFYLTVHYKGRILKAYFEELKPDYSVSFISETEPLGTAGSLKFLDGKIDKPFIVTNCDIIIDADYTSLYEFHNKEKNDITLVASATEYIIPYGTCELNGDGYLSHINEKPRYDFLVNTGLYILNPDVLNLIPENTFYHITQLIEDVNKQGKRVGVFPIDDDAWIDVGQWAEYRKVVDRL